MRASFYERKPADDKPKVHFVFGIVTTKLVWLSLSGRLVQSVDFKEMDAIAKAEPKDGVQWLVMDSPCFSVEELLASW